MKYFIINKEDDYSLQVKEELKKLLKGEEDEKNPNFVFSIGGDGTVLRAVRQFLKDIEKICFVAIHTGTLGFYTQFLPNNLDLIIQTINNPQQFINYPLLEFEFNNKIEFALNEITVSSHPKLLKAKVNIDNEPFMNIVANGICVSTPSGSTAYNKSLGGAIMDPNLNAVQLTLIAPFETVGKQMISPFVVSDQHKIVIEPENKEIEITYDREIEKHQDVKSISVKISNKNARFLKTDSKNFLSRVREKFITDK